MESLLSVGFDNISSRDSTKIRKGLRQIEGLLAQVCLSQSTSRSPHKRKSSVLSSKQSNSPKKLGELRDDPAFREFFRIQEGFQWNGIPPPLNLPTTRSPPNTNICSRVPPHLHPRAPNGHGQPLPNRPPHRLHHRPPPWRFTAAPAVTLLVRA